MKLIEAKIDEYGHLKDASYSFHSTQLTVIFGLNETGKSTLFHFIETMLYGFSKKKTEFEHYIPKNIMLYGGECTIELDASSYIKVSRFFKRHKGLPFVSKLQKHDGRFVVVEEQLLQQDEFEKLYLSGLTRAMFRDLCALTLDELQATSMKDDEQLNQHLYHATWESSKMIAQLEAESEKQLAELYRPKGTKPEINMLMSQLKDMKTKLQFMENELEAFSSIQQRLQELQLTEVALHKQLAVKSEQLVILQCVEQDYPLYEQYEAIKFEQSKLVPYRQQHRALLLDIQHYVSLSREKLDYVTDLLVRKQQVELEANRYKVDMLLLAEQKQAVEQYTFIESLIDDVQMRREQLIKQQRYITQKCQLANEQLSESIVTNQVWTMEELDQLSLIEDEEKQTKHTLALLQTKRTELEQQLALSKEQLKWYKEAIVEQEQKKASLPFSFVPQQWDELIKAEASYEECYKRFNVSETVSENGKLSRVQYQAPRKGGALTAIVVAFIAIVMCTILLITQFSVTNILLSLVIIGGALFYIIQQKRESTSSSNLHNKADNVREHSPFILALSSLIVLPAHMNHLVEWSSEQHYELKKGLQQYKELIKEVEQLRTNIASNEKESFDLSFAQQQLARQLEQLNANEQQSRLKWEQLLSHKFLPKSASIDAVKLFVQQIEDLKENIVSFKQLQTKIEQDEQKIAYYRQLIDRLLASNLHNEQDEFLPYRALLLKQQYDEHLQQATRLQQLQLQLEQLNEQIEAIQMPLQKRESEIKALYPIVVDDDIEKWKMWVQYEEKWEQFNSEMFKVEQQRKLFISVEQMFVLNEHYTQYGYTALLMQLDELAVEVESIKQRLTATVEERGQLQERATNLTSTYERQQLQLQHDMLEEQAKLALKQYAKFAIVEYVVKQTRTQFEAEHQPALMLKASLYIAQLTDGKYVKIILNPDTKTFQLATKDLSLIPIERLSRGTAELIYFSLRIALLTTHQALTDVPLIVDDPFVNFDKQRQRKMLAFLHQLAKSRQVIMLTCHEQVVDLSNQVGQAQLVQL